MLLEDEYGNKISRHIHGTSGSIDGGIEYLGGENSESRRFTHGCVRLSNKEIISIMNEGIKIKTPIIFIDSSQE